MQARFIYANLTTWKKGRERHNNLNSGRHLPPVSPSVHVPGEWRRGVIRFQEPRAASISPKVVPHLTARALAPECKLVISSAFSQGDNSCLFLGQVALEAPPGSGRVGELRLFSASREAARHGRATQVP